jgi:hypothetical protein
VLNNYSAIFGEKVKSFFTCYYEFMTQHFSSNILIELQFH